MRLPLAYALHLLIVAAQFIAAPTAFDTADTFIPPAGTSVTTFGGPQLPQSSSSEFVVSSSLSTGGSYESPLTTPPTAQIEPSTTSTTPTLTAPASTTSTPATGPRTQADDTTIASKSSASTYYQGTFGEAHDDVTIRKTFYTTVPCTTTIVTTTSQNDATRPPLLPILPSHLTTLRSPSLSWQGVNNASIFKPALSRSPVFPNGTSFSVVSSTYASSKTGLTTSSESFEISHLPSSSVHRGAPTTGSPRSPVLQSAKNNPAPDNSVRTSNPSCDPQTVFVTITDWVTETTVIETYVTTTRTTSTSG